MTTNIDAKIDLLFKNAMGADETTLYMDGYPLKDAVMNVVNDHFDLWDADDKT